MRERLRTSRLELSAFGPADAAELHEMFTDPLTYTIGDGPFTELAQTQRWIGNRMAARREHGLCWYALRERDTGALVGNCGMLGGRTGFAEPEIGYLVARRYRGRGFAAEAAPAVVAECRAAGIDRVWATIRPHNTASRRIAERLRMHADRTVHDERGPLIFYRLDLAEGRPGALPQ